MLLQVTKAQTFQPCINCSTISSRVIPRCSIKIYVKLNDEKQERLSHKRCIQYQSVIRVFQYLKNSVNLVNLLVASQVSYSFELSSLKEELMIAGIQWSPWKYEQFNMFNGCSTRQKLPKNMFTNFFTISIGLELVKTILKQFGMLPLKWQFQTTGAGVSCQPRSCF